jgi:hypothetical protein
MIEKDCEKIDSILGRVGCNIEMLKNQIKVDKENEL